jgi:hypothetical protein
MTQWEYSWLVIIESSWYDKTGTSGTLKDTGGLREILHRFGADGWEITGVVVSSESIYQIFFKRIKQA